MKVIQKEYVVDIKPMICGSYEAEIRRYKKLIGKSGRIWLVADQPDEGANIYVSGEKGSRGFAGRTLEFTTTEGEVLKLTGPWHSNSDSLYADTGYDARDKHYTFVVVGLERDSDVRYRTIIKDVVYIDKAPTLGNFSRGDAIAQKIANELKQMVMLYSESAGGSHCGPVYPEKEGPAPAA